LTKKSFEIIWQDRTAAEVYNQWRALADLGKLYSIWQDSGVLVHLGDIVHPDIVESFKINETEEKYFPGLMTDRYFMPVIETDLGLAKEEGWFIFLVFFTFYMHSLA
jgi:hypothetical protein